MLVSLYHNTTLINPEQIRLSRLHVRDGIYWADVIWIDGVRDELLLGNELDAEEFMTKCNYENNWQ